MIKKYFIPNSCDLIIIHERVNIAIHKILRPISVINKLPKLEIKLVLAKLNKGDHTN